MLENLKPPNVKLCRIIQIANGLSDSDRKIFLGAVDNGNEWPIKTLVRELSKHGINLSADTIKRHRVRSCGCP